MVFPSSFEGFGMPPMEALAAGTPCICSNIPILRELYGEYVDYVEVHDIKMMAEKIKLLATDKNYREMSASRGKKIHWGKFLGGKEQPARLKQY